MAAIPVSVAFLLLVPAPDAQADYVPETGKAEFKVDSGLNRAAFAPPAAKVVLTSPPLPSRSLPRAVDNKGFVYEPVIPADYEEPISADDEARPSPQQPRRVTDLPALAPAPSGSPEPSA